MIRRYLDVLSSPAHVEEVRHLNRVYEVRAGRAGSEVVCAVYLEGEYLDALSFMAVEIEPYRGVGEEVLVKVLMDDARKRLAGDLTFR